MFETLVKTFVYVLAAYTGFGLVFAVPFVCFGVQLLDSAAQGSGVGFRLLIIPGVVAFWPMFLFRRMRGVKEPLPEENPYGIASHQ